MVDLRLAIFSANWAPANWANWQIGPIFRGPMSPQKMANVAPKSAWPKCHQIGEGQTKTGDFVSPHLLGRKSKKKTSKKGGGGIQKGEEEVKRRRRI